MKKIISLLLAVTMILGLASAFADFEMKRKGGVVTVRPNKNVTFVVSLGKLQYRFTAKAGQQVTLPLQSGSGTYTITEYISVGGNRHKAGTAKKVKLAKKDELEAFKVSSSIVQYAPEAKAVLKAAELTAGLEDDYEKVKAIYAFIKGSFSYDYLKAASVKDTARYIVDIDEVMEAHMGVCYDLSVLMVSMLRSVGVPARLEIAEGHAWLSVYWNEKWNPVDPAYRIQTGKSLDKSFSYKAEEVY